MHVLFISHLCWRTCVIYFTLMPKDTFIFTMSILCFFTAILDILLEYTVKKRYMFEIILFPNAAYFSHGMFIPSVSINWYICSVWHRYQITNIEQSAWFYRWLKNVFYKSRLSCLSVTRQHSSTCVLDMYYDNLLWHVWCYNSCIHPLGFNTISIKWKRKLRWQWNKGNDLTL
jgi:hypothetical protein